LSGISCTSGCSRGHRRCTASSTHGRAR
jgi:hypothetical protein